MTATTRERLRQAIQNTRQGARAVRKKSSHWRWQLSTEFQQSGLTIDEIIDEIKAAASGQSNGTAPGR